MLNEKPAAASVAEDFGTTVSTTTIEVPVSPAPKGARLPIDGSATSMAIALTLNALSDAVEQMSDALDRIEARDMHFQLRQTALAVRHLYVELGVRTMPIFADDESKPNAG